MSKTAFDINIFVQNYQHPPRNPPRNNNDRVDVPDGRKMGLAVRGIGGRGEFRKVLARRLGPWWCAQVTP